MLVVLLRSTAGLVALLFVSWSTARWVCRSGTAGPTFSDAITAGGVGAACIFSLVGLVLSLAGVFSLWTSFAGCLACASVLWFLGGRTSGPPREVSHAEAGLITPSGTRWLLVLMLVGGGVLYLRGGEPLVGNWDPGVYLAQGAAIAGGGSYLFDDTASPLLSEDEKSAFYLPDRDVRVKYPGFYVSPDRAHKLEPQFYPLFPIWTALAVTFGSLKLSLYVTGVLALLSLMLVVKLGERLGGWVCAMAAGLLFLLNPVQLWFSGFPAAEVLMQFLFLAGLWCWVSWLDDGNSALARLAGTCVALIMFTSVTGLFLVAIVICAYLLQFRRRPGALGFLVPIVALLPLAAIQHFFFTRQYFDGVAYYFPALISLLTRPPVIAPLALGLLVLAAWHYPMKAETRGKMVTGARVILIAAFGCGMVMLCYHLFTGDPAHSKLRILSAMVSRVNLIVGIIGLCLLAWKRPRVGWALLVAGGLFTYVFFASRMMVRMYPWAYKRYLPVTLPLLCIGGGFAWAAVATALRRPLPRALILAAVLALGTRPLYRGRAFAFHRDWTGLKPFLEQVAETLPDDGVVFANKWIATPLEFVYGKTVLPLNVPPASSELPAAYVDLIARLRAEGMTIHLVRQPDQLPAAPLSGTRLLSETLNTSVLEQSRLPFGATPKTKAIHVEVLRVEGRISDSRPFVPRPRIQDGRPGMTDLPSP